MINEYSLLWRRLVTLAARCWGRWRGPHRPHCSGVKPIGCVHRFRHIAEQNVIGSARIACLCFYVAMLPPIHRSTYKAYTTHNSLIRSDEGVTLETSAFNFFWSIYLINTDDKSNFLCFTSPPSRHHSRFLYRLTPLLKSYYGTPTLLKFTWHLPLGVFCERRDVITNTGL